MNVVRNSVKNGLAAAALIVLCSAQVSLAGYTSVLSNNVGQVSASLGSSATGSGTNKAITPYPITNPSAGVTTVGTWTVRSNQPPLVSLVCTSTVQVLNLFGYKAVAKSYTTTGVSADASPEFSQKLLNDGYVLVPNPCGSGYTIASGDETINGQRYCVVLGNGTGGTAAWFRGFFFVGTPPDPGTVISNGIKLFDVVVQGPFNFGDINSTDRCNALKIPIAYTGPNLYLVSDGVSVSTTDLAIVNCPGNLTVCGNPTYPANITTTGGCGAATITFNPPASALPFGTNTVTATATDAAGNVSPTCTFTVTRPYLTLGSSGFASPIGGTGGDCTTPLRQVKGAGNNVPIKFSTYSCNSIFNPPTAPRVTITRLYDPTYNPPPTGVLPCTPSAVEINQQQLALTSNNWHWQWQTLPTDVGYFLITVNLGDNNPNPVSAIIQLTP